jgi:cytochrome c oxidase subunit 3
MSEFPEQPSPQPQPGGAPAPEIPKENIYVAGAGSIGIALLLVSLSVLFIASMVAFFLIRMKTMAEKPIWPPPGMPAVPQSLWLSTAVILMTSVFVQLAYNAIRRDDNPSLRMHLLITFVLGVIFLGLQAFNWWEFHHAIRPGMAVSGAYLGGFYVLTGLHAAHVIGGLIPMAIVYVRATRGRYSRNFHPGVRYVAFYWHFLDIVWIFLFLMIYF